MKRKSLSLTALVLALCLVLGACGSGTGSSVPADTSSAGDGSAASTGAAGEGGSGAEQNLRVSMAGALTDCNPLTDTTNEGAEVLGCILEGLVRQDKEGKIEQGSGLAESWTISDDGTIYTFKLRDATWSDGVPITAAQFAYAWEKVLNPETASHFSYMLYNIKGAEEYNTGKITDFSQVGVKAVDEKTLEVTLTAPADYFLSMLVIPEFGPLPENTVEDMGSNFFLDVDHMVFNGPYVMTEWIPDQSMSFKKNENYWDADSVKLDTLKIEFVIETSTIVNLFDTNQIDVMLVQPEFLDLYRDRPGFISVTEPVTEFVKFNCENEYFSNEKIRRAFSMSLNRVSYLNDFMKSGSTPAYGFVPPSITGKNGNDFRSEVGDLYYDIGTNDGALEEAKKLLEEGLKEVGKSFEEFNQGLSLVIGEGDANLKTAQVFQQFWKTNLGVDVEVRSMKYALREDAYNTGDWTIAKEGWGADYNDAQSFLELFESNSPYNDCHYSNPDYDKLMDESKSLTGDDRLAKMQEAEKVLVGDDAGIAPTFFQTRSWVTQDNVKGIVRHGIGLRTDYKWAYIA